MLGTQQQKRAIYSDQQSIMIFSREQCDTHIDYIDTIQFGRQNNYRCILKFVLAWFFAHPTLVITVTISRATASETTGQ